MLAKYSYYNEPIHNTICVGMCFFNPVNYKKTLLNIKIVIEELTKYKIPCYVIELLYPGQEQSIPNSYIVRAESVLFSKENLWNLLEKKIPDQYNKIIFMDSDVLFSDPDWINKSHDLLMDNDIIQPMEYVYKDIYSIDEEISLNPEDLDFAKNKIAFVKAIKEGSKIDLGIHAPGFVLGIDRNFFSNIGGFFEHCLTGSGDLAFWSAFIPDYTLGSHHLHSNAMNRYLDYKKLINKYFSSQKLDYVSGCIAMHLNHGHDKNRRYKDRQKYLPLDCNYVYNQYGVLEITSVIPNQKYQLINYWFDRKEDE